MISRPTTEGRIAFNAPNAGKPAETWYKIVGDLSTATPALILLHGGPGAGHNYLVSHLDLYDRHQIPIVFYDQIGAGKSTHFRERMGDEDFWTVSLFHRELDNLIDHLGLRKNGFYVLGQSWGGVLAGSYASLRPVGLKKAIIASGPSDISLYVEGTNKLLAQLPKEVRKTIEDCEKRGDYDSPEYEKASAVFAARHVCRLDPWPQPLQDTFANLKDDPTTYMTM
jgi:L-proline amide hydrolase